MEFLSEKLIDVLFSVSDDNLVEQVLSLECESLLPSGSARDCGHVEQGRHLFQQVVNSVEHNHDRDKEGEERKVKVKGEWTGNANDMESRLSDGNESHMRPGLVISNNGSSNPSSSESKEKRKYEVPVNLGDFPRALNDSLQKSLTCTVPKNITTKLEKIGQTNEPFYDSSPSASEKARMEEQLLYEERIAGHTPSFSIASDMQVEVSEGGSPPLTIGTVSPADGESVSYEGDMDKEITSSIEEMWGASSHLSGVEENESSSRAVHEICEENIFGVGFTGVNQESNHSIAPLLMHGNTVEQATMSTISFLSPRTELPEGEAQKIHYEVHQEVAKELEAPMSSTSSDELLNETLTLQVPQEITEYKSTAEESNPPKDRKNLTSAQDSEGAQSTDEIGSSGVNLNSDDSAVTSTQSEIVDEQIVFDSSSSSSPKSVLPENVFKNVDPLSSFDPRIQVDGQHSAVEDSSLLETSPENLGMTMSQIEPQLMENSMDSSSNFHRDVENMQVSW